MNDISGSRENYLFLFEDNTNATLSNCWLQNHLFAELASDSTIRLRRMDNASFHKTPVTRQFIEDAGHTLLFSPVYSPDFNPIKKDFAVMKRRRQYLAADTEIDHVNKAYVNYLE